MINYYDFVFEEIRIIGRAWVDKNYDGTGVYDTEQLFEKIGEMSWRRLKDEKSVRTILEEIGVNPDDYIPSTPIPPVPNPNLAKRPRYGMSIASLIVNSPCNIPKTLKRFVDAGVQDTRINLLSALWNGVDVLPYNKLPNGLWDLYDWNTQYLERLGEIKETFNSAGIRIVWTNRELYSWSKRKPGYQQDNTPWRHNVNGVYWSPEDVTFGVLPDQWSKDWFEFICPKLGLDVNVIEIGNEFPEKALHERDRDLIRAVVPNALIQVNRNGDTPGQYTNMKIGKNYDFISFHGNKLKDINDLDREYSNEPTYKTFQQFIDKCPHDKSRVTFSSDGARISSDPINTYDYVVLGKFANWMKLLGYGYEHQSRAKMTPPPNHHMIEVDWFKETFS